MDEIVLHIMWPLGPYAICNYDRIKEQSVLESKTYQWLPKAKKVLIHNHKVDG